MVLTYHQKYYLENKEKYAYNRPSKKVCVEVYCNNFCRGRRCMSCIKKNKHNKIRQWKRNKKL